MNLQTSGNVTDSDHLNVMLGNQRYIEMITISTLMWQPSTPVSHCALPYHLPSTSIALCTCGLGSNDLESKPVIGASGCYQLATTCQLVTTTSWQVVACYCGAF